MKPRPDISIDFLKRLWSYRDDRAKCHAIVWIDRGIGYEHFCRDGGEEEFFSDIDAWITINLPILTMGRKHIYHQILPLSLKPLKGRGRASDVLIGRWVWCDLDFKKDVSLDKVSGLLRNGLGSGDSYCVENVDHSLECVYRDYGRDKWVYVNRPPLDNIIDHVVRKTGFKPTIVIDSGNGYHIYWELDETVESRLLEKIVSWLIDRVGCDPQSRDLARILRLPGSINPRNNRLVNIIYSSSEKMVVEEIRDRVFYI